MIVAVLDTNVLASCFVGEDKPESTPGELIRRWRSGSFILVISEHILTELAGTFTDPYFTRRLPAPRIAEALDSVRIDAVVQPLTVAVSGIASHAEDDVVLATELSAGAEFLVTGDKELRQLGAYGGTRLLLPRAETGPARFGHPHPTQAGLTSCRACRLATQRPARLDSPPPLRTIPAVGNHSEK
ncbi:MAG: hypothetical protein K0S78_308 [Thermomicrobiales bacterium]|nr:hypothetical protein [Thermomicrobiales bacterium]MDF3040077.1 hypothetical protein [Thermomicrobiales bacterium]